MVLFDSITRRCIIKTLLVAAISLFLISGYAAADEDGHIAFFKNTSGNVTITRHEADLSAPPGMGLIEADRVVTGPEASAGIVFTDGTTISLDSSTEIEINGYQFEPKEEKYDFSLYIPRGTVIYSTGKLGKLAPKAVNLKTPRATVGVRGTRLIINVE